MSEHPIKALHRQIEFQQEQIDTLTLDAIYLTNQMQDVLAPAVAVMQQSQLILQMMMKANEAQRKHGLTAAIKEQNERLNKLLECNVVLYGVTGQNADLKVTNRNLCGYLQKAYAKIAEQKKEIDKLANTYQEL